MFDELLEPLLIETKISKLNSLKEYQKYLSQFPNGNSEKIKDGLMYSYDYDFYKDYPEDVVKYFDKMPLTIFIKYWPQRNLHLGLNIHFLPVLQRASFIKKIQSMNPQAFKKDGFHKVRISYLTIQSILSKSKYCVRWYRPEAISNMKMIPNQNWIETSQYAPPTFYKVKIDAVMDRHRNYSNPKAQQKLKLKESLNFDFETFNAFDPNIKLPKNVINIMNQEDINPYPQF